ncbi:NERD domain-containing protein [Streptomyces spiramyceticus]|uniref:NERD domain-containing protein n=1 Tax=Streptomyces spiramyceticus TaxID=299717 RepID=UPI00237A86D7|nr:NERD domain-containing protein [Streptomyces spiramyceticus]
MTELRIVHARHQGQDRLYVSLPDGRNIAWYDRETGRVSLLDADARDAVLAAIAPYATGPVTIGPPPVPTAADLARLTLHPDDDLAPNRPGEALHAELDHTPHATARRFRTRRFRTDPRRDALAAQELLGGELDRLEDAGWRVLHSVPLPGGAYIAHLLIGPAGAMSVRTLYGGNARQRVRIADPLVAIGRAAPLPQLRWARREAERASLALAAAVRPILALTGQARVDPAPTLRDVRILREHEVRDLARAGGVLKPADIESLYAAARDRRTWLRV